MVFIYVWSPKSLLRVGIHTRILNRNATTQIVQTKTKGCNYYTSALPLINQTITTSVLENTWPDGGFTLRTDHHESVNRALEITAQTHSHALHTALAAGRHSHVTHDPAGIAKFHGRNTTTERNSSTKRKWLMGRGLSRGKVRRGGKGSWGGCGFKLGRLAALG